MIPVEAEQEGRNIQFRFRTLREYIKLVYF
jgi:hypothetical protein